VLKVLKMNNEEKITLKRLRIGLTKTFAQITFSV